MRFFNGGLWQRQNLPFWLQAFQQRAKPNKTFLCRAAAGFAFAVYAKVLGQRLLLCFTYHGRPFFPAKAFCIRPFYADLKVKKIH